MSADTLKQKERLRGVIDFARRSVPDLRRGADTIEPVTDRAPRGFLRKAGERLDWRRLPGLRPAAPKPQSLIRYLLRRFGLFVLLPTAVVGIYLFAFAADEYVAEAKFAVRGNVEPMEDAPLGQFADLIQKHNSQDSFIARDFIQSQALVADIEQRLEVSKMFSRDEADFWSRYYGPQPLEYLTQYWRRHVVPRIDAVSGVVTLTVRAFRPEDALTIAREVIARAEVLINGISRRAQDDMVQQTQADADKAQARLRNAHLALQSYRNRWGIIDPIKTAEATLQNVAALRKDKLKAESDLQILRGSSLDEKSRSIQALVANVAALDFQIKQLQDQLTTEGLSGANPSTNITQALLEFEGLQVERTIAARLNESANFLLDKARIAAGSQKVYLVTFVPPALPMASIYPRRGTATLVAFFCFLTLWSSLALIVSAIKDQRL